MSLKSVLVHVTNTDQAQARVDAAIALAMAHDAHVRGLGVRAMSEIPPYAVPGIPATVIAEMEARQKADVAAARKIFEAALTRAGWSDRGDWVADEGDATEVTALHARYTDLTVVGQQSPSGATDAYTGFADELVLQSGRPILVIPHIGVERPIGKHIVIAWNASRESARAVADAMPLLEKSDAVEIMAVDPKGIGDIPGADIAQHLARHGINVEATHSVANQIDAGDVLLNYVSDCGADLLVMGAYGHSRMREIVLGGVTRHMLEHMITPVLMSH